MDTAFKAEIKRCSSPWLCFRESGVRTGRNKSRLTDLCVVTVEQARELLNASAVFESPPLLIVEVVSPDSVKRDYRHKRSEYAALEVPEYWIVDPLEANFSATTERCILRRNIFYCKSANFITDFSRISDTFGTLRERS